MGGRSGSGVGFSSGVGSRKSYGLNKYQKFALEAIKSNSKFYGDSKGKYFAADGYYTEKELAAKIKSDWKIQKAKTGLSDKELALQLTKGLMNHKTGMNFGNMANNIVQKKR